MVEQPDIIDQIIQWGIVVCTFFGLMICGELLFRWLKDGDD